MVTPGSRDKGLSPLLKQRGWVEFTCNIGIRTHESTEFPFCARRGEILQHHRHHGGPREGCWGHGRQSRSTSLLPARTPEDSQQLGSPLESGHRFTLLSKMSSTHPVYHTMQQHCRSTEGCHHGDGHASWAAPVHPFQARCAI